MLRVSGLLARLLRGEAGVPASDLVDVVECRSVGVGGVKPMPEWSMVEVWLAADPELFGMDSDGG